ncbi:unnamed protein product, partial [Closterium sp. NIES-54]
VLLAATPAPSSLRGVPPFPFCPLMLLLLLLTSLAPRRSGLRLLPVGGAAVARARGRRVVEGMAGAVVVAVEEAEGMGVEARVVAGVGAMVAAVEVVEAAAAAVEAAAGGGGGGGGGGAVRGGAAQHGGFGGSQRQQQPHSRETLSPQQLREWYAGRGRSGGAGPCTYVLRTGGRRGETFLTTLSSLDGLICLGRMLIFLLLTDAILAAMYAVNITAEGDCYLCVPLDPGIESTAPGAGEAAALGASESVAPGAGESALSSTAPAEALHTFTLDSGASRSFFRDSTTLTPLSRPVAVSLADPSRGPVLAHSSTVVPCPAVPSGSLSGLHLPSFSTNLVSGAALLDALVDQFTPRGQRVIHCTVLPPFPPLPAPPCLPCVEGRQRAAPHSSSFPPTTAPLESLHMDVWGPARVHGQDRERYFLLVVDDYSRFTTVFPLRTKGEVPDVLIPWIRATHLQLRERFGTDFPVLRLHSDRGGEFASDFLREFCRGKGIRQTFKLPASPHQNGIVERRIGLVMEVARTSMVHAAALHFLWPFAVRYAAHQLNLWPCVSLPETTPTLRWMGKVGDALVFWVWGSCAFVRDTTADKLSARAIPCVFLGFVPDAPGWQFYHPTSRRVLSSQDVTFDESVPFYHLFPYRTASLPPRRSSLPQVDVVEPVEVAVDSGGAAGGAEPECMEPGGAESERV